MSMKGWWGDWGEHEPYYDQPHEHVMELFPTGNFRWGIPPETGDHLARARCCGMIFIARGRTEPDAQWNLYGKLRDHVGADFASGGRFRLGRIMRRYSAPMRIQNTDDYKRYMNLLGVCTADCESKHTGLIDSGCGMSPGEPEDK